MVKIKADLIGMAGIRTSMSRYQYEGTEIERGLGQIYNDLDMRIKASGDIKNILFSLQKDMRRENIRLEAMTRNLSDAINTFQTQDRFLSRQAREMNYFVDSVSLTNIVDMFPALPLNMQDHEIFRSAILDLFSIQNPIIRLSPSVLYQLYTNGDLDALKDYYSVLKDTGKTLEWMDYFSSNDFINELSDTWSDTITKTDAFKAVGYIKDSFDLVNALNNSDVDKLEGLIDKYNKKILKGVTGLSGIEGGVYTDIMFYSIKNIGEEMHDYIQKPSLGNLLSLGWGATGGAVVDAGQNLGKDALDFVYTLFGKDFDKNDYDEAMGFLGETFTSWDKFIENGSMIVDATGQVFSDALDKVTDVAKDTADFAGDMIKEGAKMAWKGAKSLGKTVAKWLPF